MFRVVGLNRLMFRVVGLNREDILDKLVSKIMTTKSDGIVKVAVDGLMASGKTTIAREISNRLKLEGVNVIQASVDDFFNSREVRYAKGFESAIGCYQDTVNIKGLIDFLLKPLYQNRKIKRAIFDSELNKPTDCPWVEVAPDSILVFEGLFLHRPELIEFWDFSIFLKVEEHMALTRASERDLALFSSLEELEHKHRVRYSPAQQYYISHVDPELKATCTINNTVIENPTLVGHAFEK